MPDQNGEPTKDMKPEKLGQCGSEINCRPADAQAAVRLPTVGMEVALSTRRQSTHRARGALRGHHLTKVKVLKWLQNKQKESQI